MIWAVTVWMNGNQVGRKPFLVDTELSRVACDEVEAQLGLTPPDWHTNGDGKLVFDGAKWHGYEFHARPVSEAI